MSTVLAFLQAGDSVTVTAGAYIGRKGTVVKVKGRICYIFDESSHQEFEVFARDLSATAAKVLPGADRYVHVILPHSAFETLRRRFMPLHLYFAPCPHSLSSSSWYEGTCQEGDV